VGGVKTGLTYEKICSLENLFFAWTKFRKGKRSRLDVMGYERHLEDNLFALREELLAGTYQHQSHQPFTIYDPKRRQIHKASVKDRVVHQAIVSVIEPLFDPRFIHDSYSCRIGKGTHAAVDRLGSFLRQASHNNTRTIYALKCDVRKFFASVDHRVLLGLLSRRISDQRTIELLERIIGSFSSAHGRGIPLGNLTSQLFANIYLHELDLFMKQSLWEKHYVRYCDDFVTLSTSKKHLRAVAQMVSEFLGSRLRLELHPRKIFLRTWSQGIDFLGYVLLPLATILRTKTTKRMLKKANQGNANSYLGVCRHADAFELEHVVLTKVLTSVPSTDTMSPCL
jgi:retron-type reverse transcriptase